MKQSKLSKAIMLSLLCGSVVAGIHQSAWAAEITYADLTAGGVGSTYNISEDTTVSGSNWVKSGLYNVKIEAGKTVTFKDYAVSSGGEGLYNINGVGADVVFQDSKGVWLKSVGGADSYKYSINVNNLSVTTSREKAYNAFDVSYAKAVELNVDVAGKLYVNAKSHNFSMTNGDYLPTGSKFVINAGELEMTAGGSNFIIMGGKNNSMTINITGNAQLKNSGHFISNNGSGTIYYHAGKTVANGWAGGLTAGWNSGTNDSEIEVVSDTSNEISHTYAGTTNYGVLTTGCGKITLTANDGYNKLKSEAKDGIIAAANKSYRNENANITVTAKGEQGDNIIEAGRNGIQTLGPKVVLKADQSNNIKSGNFGVYSNSEGNKNGSVLLDAKTNEINASVTGVKAEIGSVDLQATNDNTITSDGDVLVATGTEIADDGSRAYNGNIKLTNAGTTTLTAGEDKNIINVSNGGVVDVNADAASQLTKATGNITAETEGIAKITFDGKDSFLTGAVYTDGGKTDASTTNLSVTNGAVWNMTDNSNVSHLNLDGGIVNMTANKNGTGVVSIDKKLSGNGTFKMNLEYIDNNVASYSNGVKSDFIYVHGENAGTHDVQFAIKDAQNLVKMNEKDKLYFATMKNGDAKFTAKEATIPEGWYTKHFTVESEDSTNADGIAANHVAGVSTTAGGDADGYKDWYITCDGIVTPPEPDPDDPDKPEPTPEPNASGVTALQSYNAAFALWRDDDTLLKRLGELRFTNDEGGVWVRTIGRKLEADNKFGFNNHAKTVQVGYDRKDVQKNGKGTWRKGIAVGHTWSDSSYDNGKGHNNYTDLTLYGTNIRKNDHYWDLVARIGRINSEYDSYQDCGAFGIVKDHGDFDNWAGSISAEYGRKKKLNNEGWYVEPQAQLTYSYMWGDDFTTRNGMKVHQGDADSLVGRAGFIISKELESERKYPHRYYAKAFIMHEFLDGGNVYDNFGINHNDGYSFKDTWYVVGVGANVDMGNQCHFYFDAERNFKASVKMPYRVEAGFRWEF